MSKRFINSWAVWWLMTQWELQIICSPNNKLSIIQAFHEVNMSLTVYMYIRVIIISEHNSLFLMKWSKLSRLIFIEGISLADSNYNEFLSFGPIQESIIWQPDKLCYQDYWFTIIENFEVKNFEVGFFCQYQGVPRPIQWTYIEFLKKVCVNNTWY